MVVQEQMPQLTLLVMLTMVIMTAVGLIWVLRQVASAIQHLLSQGQIQATYFTQQKVVRVATVTY